MKLAIFPILAAGILLSSLAQAISDEQYRKLTDLGQLNGIALQCRYFAETTRMKKALVRTLPKRRELGKAFDDVTNQSFLDFMHKGKTCPAEAVFVNQVGEAIAALEAVF